MKMLQTCKAFLEVPDFEERAELVVSIFAAFTGFIFMLSALAHLDNIGDVIVRVGFGGAMTLGFTSLARTRYYGLKTAKGGSNG